MALKDIPQTFNADSEEDLRIAVVKYFQELGFELDEIKAETRFTIQLGHNTLVVEGQGASHRDQATGLSDILLTRHGRPLAIVETKAPNHALNEKDALQALSYARLLLEMAPYAIVTNGRDTRVYDTFATTLAVLETPADSAWAKNGQQQPSIREDLRFDAAQKLIGVNAQTLWLFCQKQVAQALEDIKGSPFEGKIYIPEVYAPRDNAQTAFDTWLATDMPCFAVIAESGLGKTNFMCAAAEQLITEHFVLFYPAIRLIEDLRAALCDDFVWEFHRERGLAYIVERFTEIAREHGRQFIIFVDGLDEFPGDLKHLKNELLDLVKRLRGSPIRLCLSCKAFDWTDFVVDNGRSYNQLAHVISPLHQVEGDRSQAVASPDPRRVGFWLQEYTDEELEEAFANYKKIFTLQGTLQGIVRSECSEPLILRLLAEVCSSRKIVIPSEISQQEVYEWYWTMQMSKVQQKLDAERWLSTLAQLSVESEERQVDQDRLIAQLSPMNAQNTIYQELLRCGLLRISYDAHMYPKIRFGLEKLRSYVYTLKVQAWPKQMSRDVAKMICNLVENPLGYEAVEFYLRTVDRGETQLLTDVALHDIHCFVRLIDALNIKSSVFEHLSDDSQQRALLSHLEQYAIAYSELSRHYFPELCEKVEPYMKDEVGLWVSDTLSMHQLRTRTPAYPQPVVIVPKEIALTLWNQKAPPKVYADLQPGGTSYLDIGMRKIVDQLPQKMAWERILSQVAGLFVNRCLDETASPELLEERAWKILLEEPSLFCEGVPVTGEYWQVLGFQTIQDVQKASIDELMTRTRDQIQQYMNQFTGLIRQYETEIFNGAQPAWSRWFVRQIRLLKRLYYSFSWLYAQCRHLELPSITPHDLFDYPVTGPLIQVVSIVEQLLPSIFRSYASLVQKNFSQLADRLAFFKYSDASMLVEVTHQPSHPPHQNDFLRIAYVVLPTVNLPKKYLVYSCEEKDSLAHIVFTEKRLRGWTRETSGAHGARFGQAPLSRYIGDVHIKEPNAFFCFTRFPSRHPIIDQAYQLLGHEVCSLLEGDFKDWYDVEIGRIENEQLDWWISRQTADLGLSF